MRTPLVLAGWLAASLCAAAAGAQPAAADHPMRASGRPGLRLPTDLDPLADPLNLPARRHAGFYREHLGPVLEFLGALAEGSVERDGQPVGLEQLRRDAARLARVRLRQTEEDRERSGRMFDAFRDMLGRPEFYAGRPFTARGHVRRLIRLDPEGPDEDNTGLYEASIESNSDPSRPVLAVLVTVPGGLPSGADLRVPVTVTGYLFRAEYDAPPAREAGFTPLLVAWTLHWHGPELSEAELLSLTSAVEHRTPHRPEETDEFYRLLKHAQVVDYGAQQQAARRFLHERIKEFPEDSRADLEHRLVKLAARREAAPNDAGLERAVRQANGIYAYEQQQYRSFRDSPERFPTFAHLFRSVDSSEPHRYTGRLVTLAGHLRKHVSYPADPENEYGIGWLHEVWLYPEDGDSNPVVVVCTSVSEGLPQGEKLLERAAVTGYFYKMWAYPARDTMRVAPMILANRLQWFPARQAAEPPGWLIAAVWVAGGVAAIAVVWAACRWGRTRRGVSERYIRGAEGESPDFSQLT